MHRPHVSVSMPHLNLMLVKMCLISLRLNQSCCYSLGYGLKDLGVLDNPCHTRVFKTSGYRVFCAAVGPLLPLEQLGNFCLFWVIICYCIEHPDHCTLSLAAVDLILKDFSTPGAEMLLNGGILASLRMLLCNISDGGLFSVIQSETVFSSISDKAEKSQPIWGLSLAVLCLQQLFRRQRRLILLALHIFPSYQCPYILHGLQDQGIAINTELCAANKMKQLASEIQSSVVMFSLRHPAFIPSNPEVVEKFVVVHGQIILPQSSEFPDDNIKKCAFIIGLAKMEE
ncbi:hypothetical protein Pfo_007968 [Paulownia fortunei]|nr:hypothetical protein Pfo_007968 [Paulownia fortunei]